GFNLQKFQLQAGDVLIAGSDGKDDLNLKPGSQKPEINFDYGLILRQVEKSEGNLKPLVKSLYTVGEPTDDLSMIRVGFQESRNVPENTIPEALVYKLKISSFIRNKKFQKALELMEGDSEKQNAEILMYRGYCLIREKRYLKSLKYLTRSLQLKPDFFSALKYAGMAHYFLGNYKKTEEYWSQAIDLKPSDPFLKKRFPQLQKRLEKQKVLLGHKQLQE
ncbi:MAG: hypothetical protein KDK25_14000, partial [Leptospiraceae bacterium]|nr:hypothetical protein [Leptospiraceae bacterium]